jgi:phage tail protein X
MTTTYTSVAGDTADLIAWRYYGGLDGRQAEQLLAANPGLAELGAVLPAGVVITLPDLAATATTQGVRLWS